MTKNSSHSSMFQNDSQLSLTVFESLSVNLKVFFTSVYLRTSSTLNVTVEYDTLVSITASWLL